MKRVCVFLGSSPGVRPEYREAAEHLGALIAARGLTLVYGGGNVGLMGTLADAALAGGGEVVGVLPAMLVDKEVAHRGLTDLRIVPSMNDRKTLMAELSDAFVTLPGGTGTLDELFEMLTWTQLHVHEKPNALLNVAGYYDDLLRFLDATVAAGFLKEKHRKLLRVESSAEAILDGFLYTSSEKIQHR